MKFVGELAEENNDQHGQSLPERSGAMLQGERCLTGSPAARP